MLNKNGGLMNIVELNSKEVSAVSGGGLMEGAIFGGFVLWYKLKKVSINVKPKELLEGAGYFAIAKDYVARNVDAVVGYFDATKLVDYGKYMVATGAVVIEYNWLVNKLFSAKQEGAEG